MIKRQIDTLKQKLKKPFLRLELSFAIRNFALGLISLFIPIYLIEKGFEVSEVIWYYIVFLLVISISSVMIGYLSQLVKFKYLMIAHYPLFLVMLICLYSIDVNLSHLLIVGALQGVASSFYWLGHHLKFRIFSDHSHRGVDAGIDRSVREIAKSLAPVFGGLIIGLISPEALFTVSAIIYITAVIPLSTVPHIDVKFEPKHLLNTTGKLNRSIVKLWFIHGWVDAVLAVSWPLFIYLFITQEYQFIGLLAGLSVIILVVESIFTGDLYDKGKKYIIRLGGLGTSILFSLMFLAQTLLHAVGINIFKEFAVNLYSVPLTAEFYNDSEGTHHLVDYFIKQEFFTNVSKAASLSFILIVPSFNYIFLITSLLVFAILVVGYSKKADKS